MTARLVRTRLRDGIAFVIMDNPPVNALSGLLRGQLAETFTILAQQKAANAIVLLSNEPPFSAGANVLDYDRPDTFAGITEVCRIIEDSPVPVVAGLSGLVLGDGLALALAAHYRVADAAARIGLPDVTLGLTPSGGATQRLPRMAGAERALDMMLGGRPIDMIEAQQGKLVDGVTSGDLPSAAFAFAKNILEKGKGVRRSRDRTEGAADPAAYLQSIGRRRAALRQSRMNAPRRIVDCVEAALLLPFEAGQIFESDTFGECLSHQQSRALRHIFMAERQISKTLLEKHPKGFWQVTESGQVIVERLRSALRVAVDHIAGLGVPPAKIDTALLQFGFVETPFGGTEPGTMSREHLLIQRRCVSAMMAEGANMVRAGAVQRPSDIDALAVHGMSFPRFQGGPMKAVHLFGLLQVRREMQRWAEESRLWTPPPLLNEAIKYANGFEGIPAAHLRPE